MHVCGLSQFRQQVKLLFSQSKSDLGSIHLSGPALKFMGVVFVAHELPVKEIDHLIQPQPYVGHCNTS